MYSLAQLRRGLQRGLSNPAFFGRELNRLYYRRFYSREYNVGGVDVMAEDWDVLVILDACRYDLFAAYHDFPGTLDSRVSRGSHTTEFLRGNFAGRDLRDTVYVTASPQFYRRRTELGTRFHAVDNVWRDDGWDDEHGTVLPGTTTEHARDAAERYPNKRLIVHYLQPHYPFLSDPELSSGDRLENGDGRDIWGRIRHDELEMPVERVERAYRRNLERVLPSVHDLVDAVTGKVVVTSDHGNMFGEVGGPIPVREWGHPPGIYTEPLVKVPWLEIGAENRRRVVAGEGENASEKTDVAVINERLRDLGYAE